jgi:RHH-type proline utilization regulon transcriptional repressor/proline dehydrogenase/delta 1-pyrroline-5-carboxylate dehydrogenase
MRARGRDVAQAALPAGTAQGNFVAPAIIAIKSLSDLTQEVFGPVLHVLRFRRDGLDALIDAINAMGFGLTFGLHTRLDATTAHVTGRIRAGNLYVNRNVIGAVVGVQPFGGRGLSGTGPKAGGPLYLGRLTAAPPRAVEPAGIAGGPLAAFADWLDGAGEAQAAARARAYGAASPLGHARLMPGPVGERNHYALHPRGRILARPATRAGLFEQMAAILATGNRGRIDGMALPDGLPAPVAAQFAGGADEPVAAALVESAGIEDAGGAVAAMVRDVATLPGPVVPVHASEAGRPLAYVLDWLVDEVATSINTTAAGGNASLMMMT